MLEILAVRTRHRNELIDITREINRIVENSGIDEGMCCLFVPHTTAAITINENADPTVKSDMVSKLNKMIPEKEGYSHLEGNSDSHVKSTLVGPSLNLIVTGGRPLLGTWQGVYFYEFDGPRNRKVHIKVFKG
ncbi:MAG: YjbQ family protein [Actinobacteria bacterium]|nr:YjbQ family protein [Actinomycetota bacterium]